MTKFNVPDTYTWTATNAKDNIQGLYAQVAHWHEKNEKESAANRLLSLFFQASQVSQAEVRFDEESIFKDAAAIVDGSWEDNCSHVKEAAPDKYRKIDNHCINTKYSNVFKATMLQVKENQSTNGIIKPKLYLLILCLAYWSWGQYLKFQYWIILYVEQICY